MPALNNADVLRSIEPSILLEAIKQGAKPKVEAHLSPATEFIRKSPVHNTRRAHDLKKAKETELQLDGIRDHAHFKVVDRLSDDHEHEREALAKSFKLKHKEEAKQVKETEKRIGAIRDHANFKIEDHLSDDREHEREALAKSCKLKHKEEAKEVKAARRRLEAIKKSAHFKVEDHILQQEEAYEEELHQRKLDQIREAKRELKAHQRSLKTITKAMPRVDDHLSEQTEHDREQLAQAHADNTLQYLRQLQRSRQVIKALRSNADLVGEIGVMPTTAEIEHHAAVLLQAARRGSLSRRLKTPPEQSDEPMKPASPTTFMRRALDDAINNRLSRRRPPVFDYGIEGNYTIKAAHAMSRP